MSCKKLFIISVFLATFTLGTALKCYACSGTATSDCARGKGSSIAIQQCYQTSGFLFHHAPNNNSELNDEGDEDLTKLQVVCLQLYLTDYQPKLLARGCGILPPGVDPCTFINKRVHIQGCKSCTTDLCNNKRGDEYDPVVDMIF